MHFGRLCKLRVRQWTVNPSPALTRVWSPHSLWSVSPYWFQTGNSMSVTQCCQYKCVSEYQSLKQKSLLFSLLSESFFLFYAPTADVINPMQFCVQHRLCEYPKECLLLGDSNRFDLTFFSGQNIGIGNGNGGGHVPLSGQ